MDFGTNAIYISMYLRGPQDMLGRALILSSSERLSWYSRAHSKAQEAALYCVGILHVVKLFRVDVPFRDFFIVASVRVNLVVVIIMRFLLVL